jgi:hypothetical protein
LLIVEFFLAPLHWLPSTVDGLRSDLPQLLDS